MALSNVDAVYNVFTALFKRKSKTSTIQSTGENEGDAVDDEADDNNDATNAVKVKVLNVHAEQEATDDVALHPTAKCSKMWIYLSPDFSG
ncbi:hypothetical protein MAM1_0272d09048 [Mucor ambiguus]|uniref:Uncharacterized protein n=1 Tax=Mucor ambiguus TaxID=91626 RepID=A0A0C9N4K5_9FUNG|nr:hypothetical protein MAM1_0272d09048 [Mucor ambiguus]